MNHKRKQQIKVAMIISATIKALIAFALVDHDQIVIPVILLISLFIEIFVMEEVK